MSPLVSKKMNHDSLPRYMSVLILKLKTNDKLMLIKDN